MAELTPVVEKIIVHWGEMGATWGINRTVAQIYALLYLSPDPLTAEEISKTLSVARSTVSTGLRELQGWGVVRIVHVLGDRRDHFEAMSDVWEMFRVILAERKRREMDPTLAVLRESVAELLDTESEGYVQNQVLEMLDFFETATTLYDQLAQMSTATLTRIARSLEGNLGEVLKILTKK